MIGAVAYWRVAADSSESFFCVTGVASSRLSARWNVLRHGPAYLPQPPQYDGGFDAPALSQMLDHAAGERSDYQPHFLDTCLRDYAKQRLANCLYIIKWRFDDLLRQAYRIRQLDYVIFEDMGSVLPQDACVLQVSPEYERRFAEINLDRRLAPATQARGAIRKFPVC